MSPRRSSPKVGFYGCAAGAVARIVRVGLADQGKPPRFATVDCPACGERHRVGLMWRQVEPLDEDREPEVYVDVLGERYWEKQGDDDLDADAEAV